MMTVAVPYHLDARLDRFNTGLTHDREVTAALPTAGPWQRMAVLYEQLAQLVAEQDQPGLIVSGDCTTSLGTLAGLQRGGHDPSIVWLDAHADFHTEASSTSGYLGGMPLALAAGLGTQTMPAALGLRPVPTSRILLVDARDTDPGEEPLLERAAIRRAPIHTLPEALPKGELYLHIDVDVCEPRAVPGLLYPAPAGTTIAELVTAVRQVIATARVAAVGIAATWHHHDSIEPAQHHLMQTLHQAATG